MWPTSRPKTKVCQRNVASESFRPKPPSELSDEDKENKNESQIIDIIQQWQISEGENESLRQAVDSQEISLRKYKNQNRMLLSELGQLRQASGSEIITYDVHCNPLPASPYAGYPFSRMSLYKSRLRGRKLKDCWTETNKVSLKHTSTQTGNISSFLQDKGTSTENLVSGPTIEDCKTRIKQKDTIIDELKKLNESTRKEVTDLKKKLDEQTEEFQICARKTEETQESCRQHMIQHETKVKEKEGELTKSKKIVAELRKTTEQQYNELKRHKSQIEEIKSERASGKKELVTMKSELTKLTADVKTKDEMIGKMVDDIKDVKTKRDLMIKTLVEEQKKMSTELKETKQEEQRRTEDMSKLQKSKEKCEELYRDTLKKVVAANSETEKLNKKIIQLEGDKALVDCLVGDLRKQSTDMLKRLAEKDTGFKTLDSTISSLRQKVWDKENLLRKSRSQLQALLDLARHGAYGTMFQRWMQEQGSESFKNSSSPPAAINRAQGTPPKSRLPTDPTTPNKISLQGQTDRSAHLKSPQSRSDQITDKKTNGTPERKTNNATCNVHRKVSTPEFQRKGTDSLQKERTGSSSASKTNLSKPNARWDLSSPSNSPNQTLQRAARASTSASNIRVLQRPKVSSNETNKN